MAKVTLTDLTNLQNEQSVVNAINANNAAVEAAIENTLSRDGTAPNTMNDDLDMNSNRIYNLLAAVDETEPVRKAEFDQSVGGVAIAVAEAQAAAAEAQAILDQIEGTYFGGLAADPLVDPNGGALTAGDVYFNTVSQTLRYYNGSAWVDFPVQSGLITRQTYVATAGQTTFTVTGGYSAPYLLVYYNGVLLYPSEYTATNGTTVVLASGAALNSEISIIKFAAFEVTNALDRFNNLSDLDSVSIARTNLGLGSIALLNSIGTANVDNDAITYAKIQNVTDNRLLGRSAGSDGDMQEITVGTGLSLSAGSLTSTAAAPISLDPGFSFTATVAANALTIALKTSAGADPSAGSPLLFKVRNPTATTSAQDTLTINSATSLVVSSGSTLGVSANIPFRLRVVLFNDSGTPRLGVVNPRGSASILVVKNNRINSSTAEGGAGGADTAQTFYTGTAVTVKPYIVLGYIDWNSGLAVPGTWDTAPSTVQTQSTGVPFTGDVVNIIAFSEGTGSSTTSTSYAAVNNSTANFTQSFAGNPYKVSMSAAVVILAGGAGTNTSGTVAVFRGATELTSNQVIANADGSGTNVNQYGAFSRTLIDYPGDTGATNFSLKHKRDNGGTMTTSAVQIYIEEISL